MTGERATVPDALPLDIEAHETLLKRLRDSDAPEETIAEAAWAYLERLLTDGYQHLSVWHACQYEASWDDERKLDILERLANAEMSHHAITLCHRWKLSDLCDKTKHRLYRELFPKLPPRTDKKETP